MPSSYVVYLLNLHQDAYMEEFLICVLCCFGSVTFGDSAFFSEFTPFSQLEKGHK